MYRFLYMLAAIGKAVNVAKSTRRKIDLQAQQQIINEAKIAHENNRVLIQDLQIELLKLKIEREQKELYPKADEFRSEDY